MEAAEGACLSHIAKESTDVKRLASFYQEILGLERLQTPNIGPGNEVIWLRLPPSSALHLIQRKPDSEYCLPEGPLSATSVVADPKFISRSHHLCVRVSNFDAVVRSLKARGIATHEKSVPSGKKIKQVFFFDPDGNGLEVQSPEEV